MLVVGSAHASCGAVAADQFIHGIDNWCRLLADSIAIGGQEAVNLVHVAALCKVVERTAAIGLCDGNHAAKGFLNGTLRDHTDDDDSPL